jgi:tetratricopeptide (TPR) repeat protein
MPATPTNWNDECRHAAELFEKGDYVAAAHIFSALCERTDLAESERGFMAHNLAMAYDKMGEIESAVATYEFAASMSLGPYIYMQSMRAGYLFEHGRKDDAIAIWQHLLTLDNLQPKDRHACEHNLKIAGAM